MILAVDWILLYHGPQLGPINCGMWYFLISIFVGLLFCFCYEKVLRVKGAYTSRCQMPKEFLIEFLGLSHKGAYTSRCQMPEFEQEKMMDLFKWVMVCILVTIQIRSDLLIEIGMSMFVMEGMLERECEVRPLPTMVSMVPLFLSLIFLLQTLYPSIPDSTKRFP